MQHATGLELFYAYSSASCFCFLSFFLSFLVLIAFSIPQSQSLLNFKAQLLT